MDSEQPPVAGQTRPRGRAGERAAEQTRTTVWRFLTDLYRLTTWRLAGLVLLALLMSAASGVGLLMLIPLLGTVGLDVAGGTTGWAAELVDALFSAVGATPTLPAVLLLYVLVVAATALLAQQQAVRTTQLTEWFANLLRQRLYRALLGARWRFLVRERSTDATHVLTKEVDRASDAVHAVIDLLVNAGLTLAYAVTALVLSPVMTLIAAGCSAVLSLLVLRPARAARAKGEAVSRAYGGLYDAVGEHLAGLRVVKGLGIEERQVAAFARASDRAARSYVDVVRNRAAVSFWMQTGSVLALGVIVFFAFDLLDLPAAAVLLLLYVFSRLLPGISALQRGYQSLINLLPAYDLVMAAIDRSEAAAEAGGAEAGGAAYELERAVELRGVTFRHEPGVEGGVEGLDLLIPAGSTVALVGPSGAGKSTIADLVIGLIHPEAGRVLIDGQPLVPERARAWRGQIGYVAQDVFLFHDTIRANLLVAEPRATDEELWEALRAASAEFVAALPDGLDTLLGDRGVNLSGGERQRLALARALLRRPPLLVLDEATSSLDAENEDRIRRAIDGLHGRTTILVIAHRLSSIRSADAIHVVVGGRVVESGTWRELAEREGGRFRELAAAQGLAPGVAPRHPAEPAYSSRSAPT